MLKKITLFISSFLFSILFYGKNIGLNYLLFSILVILLLATLQPKKFKTKKILIRTLYYLAASTFVFIYNSSLSIFVSIVSLFALLGALPTFKASLYVEFLNGCYTAIASSFTNYYHHMLEETEAVKKKNINYSYWIKTIGIPILIVGIFILLYSNANPNFNRIVSTIDLSFINLKWVLFTLLGYFILLNFSDPQTIQPLTQMDSETENQLDKSTIPMQSSTSLLQENQLGIILLISLNLLIGFFLTTDIFYLHSLIDVVASDLSKSVHEGIYALITSLIFAIIIILYFFRGNLNYYKKNQHLKTLATIWILLNVVLVVITAYKNYLYVTHYGFTYKRIGVFIYLFLSSVGLITTYIKVHARYNLWYLLRKNIHIAFMILVFSSVVNWDQLITKYNINHAQITDIDYLINLSNNNVVELKEFVENNKQKTTKQQAERITKKYLAYTQQLKVNSWQEFTYDNLKIKK